MASPQATQNSNSPHPRQGDSVRITAAIRRQILAEFFANALPVQRAVTEAERADRATVGGVSSTGLFTTADLRVSNAVAIQQWIASQHEAYSDNREFGASAVTR